MAFYLLTWTYFNGVSGGRNILINSQLKRILLISNDKKKGNKNEKTEKKKEKENGAGESDFIENETPDLNSLKPFKFELKKASKALILVAVMMRKKIWKIK